MTFTEVDTEVGRQCLKCFYRKLPMVALPSNGLHSFGKVDEEGAIGINYFVLLPKHLPPFSAYFFFFVCCNSCCGVGVGGSGDTRSTSLPNVERLCLLLLATFCLSYPSFWLWTIWLKGNPNLLPKVSVHKALDSKYAYMFKVRPQWYSYKCVDY